MQDTLLSLQHITKNFGEGDVLRDISLDVARGEFVTLLGASGCGKTTLLRMIADLIDPSEGKVTVDGTTPREARLHRKYGMVFQSPVLYEWRTVMKNIELPLEIIKTPKAEREERAMKMLDLVGLSSFADHHPSELSGGMQQRVGIARALALNPDILLLFPLIRMVTSLQRHGMKVVIVI